MGKQTIVSVTGETEEVSLEGHGHLMFDPKPDGKIARQISTR